MKLFTKVLLTTAIISSMIVNSSSIQAATSPSLGAAATFGVLSETFTNTIAGTTINGDLWYITAPAMAPTVNGTTYIGGADPTIIAATAAQWVALANLNAQVLSSCTVLMLIVHELTLLEHFLLVVTLVPVQWLQQ